MIRVLKNYALNQLNSLRLESHCAYFVKVDNRDQLKEIIQSDFFDVNNFFIIGEGSNLILPEYYSGTVMRITFTGFSRVLPSYYNHKANTTGDITHLKVGAGESWSNLISYCLANNLKGLENLTLIPGSVGAAPIQNIGAYGVEVSDLIESVEVFNLKTGSIELLSNKACCFSYRGSVFKQNPSRYIILSVIFVFDSKVKLNTAYASLAKRIHDKGLNEQVLTARDISELVASIRRERLPNPEFEANAGSFFKNPVVSVKGLESLKQQFTDIIFFPYNHDQYKLSAAWLIEYCGWRGKVDGAFMVSDKHALVVINRGGKAGEITQEKLLSFAEKIQNSVKETFSIQLEIEPVVK